MSNTKNRPKNPCGKMRPVDNPYAIYRTADGAWEWHVLKKYQTPEKEAQNPYARWFCAVYSPITRKQTSLGYELGGVYVSTIMVEFGASLVEGSVTY